MDLFGDLPPPAGDKASSLCDEVSPDSGIKRQAEESIGEERHPKKVKKEVYCLRGYLGERQGERDDMQDAHVMIDDIILHQITSSLPEKICRISYYGVFDGHAGPRASQYAAENLHKNIISKLPKVGDSQHFDREVKRCLIESFKKTDEEFLSLAAKATPSWKDGSTAVVLLIIDNTIFSGNLGDSKAVLCRKEHKMTCIPLTKTHTPVDFDERKRIEKSGGIVRDGRVMGVVEVSRSIGDGRFKHCGVISTPDIFKCQLTDNDLFLLVACDGLWNVFKPEEAAEYILQIIEDEKIQPSEDQRIKTNYASTDAPISVRSYRYETACNRLAVEAVKRGCTDNVTVMVIDIQQP